MREIKFRGIRIDKEEMIFGSLCKGIQEGTMCIMPNTFFGTVIFTDEEETKFNREQDGLVLGGWFGIKPETVGQFTGLKDKNGVEIYDNDVIEWNKINYKVIWQGYSCEYMLQDFSKSKCYATFSHRFYNEYKVIGNIHQNPELLCK